VVPRQPAALDIGAHATRLWPKVSVASADMLLQMSDRMKMSQATLCFKLTGSFAALLAMVAALSLCARQGIRSLGGSLNATGAGSEVSLDHWEVSVAVAFGLLAGIAGLWVVRQVAVSAVVSQPVVSLEETSGATLQTSSMTLENPSGTRDATQLIHADTGFVAEANSKTDSMQTSIREMVVPGGKTSQMVNAMDGLAFQVNLLALSAGVAAAHTGEEALGFAVGAQELGSPAQRDAAAARDTARDTKHLIDKVNHTGQEQVQSLEHLARAIAQMEQVTTTTAAISEQPAATSEQLSAQSRAMV
jgi:hypothetical protein